MEQWSPELRRAWLIAAYARRFRQIATTFGYDADEREERLYYALGGGPHARSPQTHLFDLAGIAGASDLDRFCAAAVVILDQHGDDVGPHTVDLLASLEPDRAAAIYFALPPERRRFLRRDPYWETYIAAVEPAMSEAERRLRELLDATLSSAPALALASADLLEGAD
jgi:hypothetical protein